MSTNFAIERVEGLDYEFLTKIRALEPDVLAKIIGSTPNEEEDVPKLFQMAVPNRNYENTPPEKIIVRQLEFGMQNGLKVSYPYRGGKLDDARTNAPQTITSLESTLKNHFNDEYFLGRRLRKDWDILNQRETSLSLDVNNNPPDVGPINNYLVILRIIDRNLQFNQFGAPISVKKSDVASFGANGKVHEGGDLYVTTALDSNGAGNPNSINDCRTAFFVVTALPHGTKFLPFNIHLDLIGRDIRGTEYTIPIIIDPDVRHPGGSGDS
ncbi:hypothetical protein [Parasphingorhabdus sp.]|uniref:hypothetical protein n=1 Tax=Parasphingorhabdus sp. TaxID=2709688 RepID=UPI003D284CFA